MVCKPFSTPRQTDSLHLLIWYLQEVLGLTRLSDARERPASVVRIHAFELYLWEPAASIRAADTDEQIKLRQIRDSLDLFNATATSGPLIRPGYYTIIRR